MNFSRRDFAVLLTAGKLAAQQTPPPTAAAKTPLPDIKIPDQAALIVKAMVDEMARSRQLRLVGQDPLYYIEYALDDADSYSVTASLGGLLAERRAHFRIPRVSARVGSPAFDNTNYLLSDVYFGVRYDPENFPLDDDYNVLRQAFWLATDRAFKTAIEAIGRKKAALRNVTQNEKLPDFTAAQPARFAGNLTRLKLNEAEWRNRAIALSGIFSNFPEIQESSVDFEGVQSTAYYLNSEGSIVLTPDTLSYFRIRAASQAQDGMRVRDHATIQAVNFNTLPSESEMRQTVQKVAASVKALASAPVAEAYSGPIAFEGEAAAQFFAEMLSSALPATRRPVVEPGRPFNWTPSIFEGRIGSRILPSSFTVVDDPTQKELRGRNLLGHYAVDLEGIAGTPLTVIEKGILKTLLSTRTPSRDAATSNGRARIPGSFSTKSAAISNLFIKSSETVEAKELRSQLLKIAADRNLPYAMVIRKMDFPSSASITELRQTIAGQERPVSIPLLAYRIYPDGREELVRGLRFRGLTARLLRDITVVTNEENFFDFTGNGAPLSLIGGGSYVYLSTVVAPSILFEDLELERIEQDLPRLPIVQPPTLVPTK